ncbi:LysM domain-containing protein [Vibrio artabrorum]|uniref:LysM peptidoglycan-binding domain-containing protein n=1 Tax=Vibrio artabrorum TaxID=446374 RepID=A0ABT8CI47_9VIBR|nr:LysM peptidoglycan-binding domain-containing protein [Vibrio artabrorum]MDN3700121.1 LysM peptidoglycan-binding domain-containing protein [Vibrio artabrorum]
MNLKSIALSITTLSALAMSGCASNDDLIAAQEKQQQQITQLESQIEKVEQKTQKQERAIQMANQQTNKLLTDQAKEKEQKSMRYVVKENDTLYSIAKEHRMGVDALTQLNPQLSNPNLLLIGSTINVK